MISHALASALADLSTDRIQRLVDRIENEADIELTVRAWRPQCPMVIAGFDPEKAAKNTAEQRFAFAWDRFAVEKQPRWWTPRLRHPTHRARQCDVQALLRAANAMLAQRTGERSAPGRQRVAEAPRTERVAPPGVNAETHD